MRVISAKILDPTHLELSQPLDASPGDVIQISLALDEDAEMAPWREAAKQRLLDAYATRKPSMTSYEFGDVELISFFHNPDSASESSAPAS